MGIPPAEAFDIDGDELVSIETVRRRLALRNAHQVRALEEHGDLNPVEPKFLVPRSGPGRPTAKFFRLGEVEKLRIRHLQDLDGVDCTEVEELKKEIESLRSLQGDPHQPSQASNSPAVDLADRIVALQREVDGLRQRNDELEAAFGSGLDAQQDQLNQLNAFRRTPAAH